MKRVFIIHGWGGNPNEGWFPWLKNELGKRGFSVAVPAMPNSDEPKIETWIPFLSKTVGKPDQQTYFVGHSIGCQTIIRYLQTLPSETKIGGAVFVAGWYNLRSLETEKEKRIAGPWVNEPRDDKKIREIVNKAIAIFSDNDPFVISENQLSWKERVGAKIIVERGKGHFGGSDGVTELPSALDAVLELAGAMR
ncbi:MAG: alpha/beta hydrolase [Patescibacteria group bacterium]